MRVFLVIISLLLVISCASKTPKHVGNPVDLYVEGINFLNNRRYDKAIERFALVRDNFPFDPISVVASLKLGDAYFGKKEYLLASSIYEDFFRLYPDDENIPYVLSRLGECFEKISLPLDRDQSYTYKAIEYYGYLKNRYPQNPFSSEAERRIAQLKEKLCDREFSVGEFYFRSKKFLAAIGRFEYILNTFSEYRRMDKVISYLILCNQELGNEDRAQHYADILRQRYPNSPLGKSHSRYRGGTSSLKGTIQILRTAASEEIELVPNPVVPQSSGGDLGFFRLDEKKPVEIRSDIMEGFEKERYIIFRGNVLARQEDLFIFADELLVFFMEGGRDIERAVAKGNVKIVKGERVATSKEALFDNKKGEVLLRGDVIVYSGSDRVKADEALYYINDERIVVKGGTGGRANVVFTPKQGL